jgi:serine/threonine protein kinase
LSDEIGDRVLVLNDRKVPSLELLRFHKGLTAMAGFEVALRRRVERLRHFRDPSFPPVPAVEYIGDRGLILLGPYTPGTRLSDVLDETRAPSFAIGLIRQLTPALAALHHHGDGIGHGALSPSRILIAPQGRLVITEHVLGTALERLQLSAARMHLDLGITLPPTSSGIRPRPDSLTDVYQLALIAVALLLGRRVSPTEYPPKTSEAIEEIDRSLNPEFADEFGRLRPWLERALQIEGDVFASSQEAVEALHDLPAVDPDRMAEMWSGLVGPDTQPPEEIASPSAPDDAVAASPDPDVSHPIVPAPSVDHGEAEPATETPEPAPDPFPVVFLTPDPESPEPAAPPLEAAADPVTDSEEEMVNSPPDDERKALWPAVGRMRPGVPGIPRASWTWVQKPRAYVRWAIAALVVCALIEAVIIASLLRRGMDPAPPQLAEIKVETPDPGASVILDGRTLGVTPLNLKISPEVRSLSVVSAQPPAVVGSTGLDNPASRGSDAAKAKPAAPAAATPPPQRTGGIRLVSPIELDIFEGDARLGSSATGIVTAAAGRRELELVNSALGYRSRQVVDVKAGQVVALTVTPPTGRVNINAQPWAEVFISGKLIGETPIGNFALPLGEHEIVFRHPQLGEQRRKVVVRLDTVNRVSANLEK